MTLRVRDWLSALRRTVAIAGRIMPAENLPGRQLRRSRLAVAVLAACSGLPPGAQAAAPAAAHARATAGVVMMIGGMASDNGDVVLPAHETPTDSIATPGAFNRVSVVIQPGRSILTDAVRQTSASTASRVMALAPIIDEAARSANVDRALLMAMIDVESGGNPQAVSSKGATGLMQLMPATGVRHGASDLFDPRQNVAAGARYLQALIRQFGALPLVLAAYNAGEGAVQKYGGQIPPYAETMNYVPKVIARYKWYRDAALSSGAASAHQASDRTRGRLLPVSSGAGD